MKVQLTLVLTSTSERGQWASPLTQVIGMLNRTRASPGRQWRPAATLCRLPTSIARIRARHQQRLKQWSSISRRRLPRKSRQVLCVRPHRTDRKSHSQLPRFMRLHRLVAAADLVSADFVAFFRPSVNFPLNTASSFGDFCLESRRTMICTKLSFARARMARL